MNQEPFAPMGRIYSQNIERLIMKKRLWPFLLFCALIPASCERSAAPSPGSSQGPAAAAPLPVASTAGSGQAAIHGPSFTEKIAVYPEPATYDLAIDVDYDSGSLSAVCKLAVKNSGAGPVTIVPLNLYRLMEVASVTDGGGKPLEFGQRVSIFEDWREFQVNHVRVKMDPPLAPGASATLVIRYGGPLLGYAEAMRYVKDRVDKDMTLIRSDSLAIPEIGVPSWRENRARGLKNYVYRVSVTVPASLVVANGGRLVSRTEANGKATYTYESKVPSWRIDLAISNYETLVGADGGLKIFALSADREGAKALLARLTDVLGLYGRWFGPLKSFHGLTVIEIPAGCGSQADAAAVIQEADAFKDPSKRYTFYHELAHLWGVEAKDPLPCRFESEGLAMLLQHLVEEELDGKAGAAENAVSRSLARLSKNFAEHPAWQAVPMIAYGEKDLTDLSYRMGQVFFYLLRESLGEKAFLDAVGGFYQEYAATGATTRQFVEYIKKRSDVSLDRLFDEWVFTAKAAELVASGTPLAAIVERYRSADDRRSARALIPSERFAIVGPCRRPRESTESTASSLFANPTCASSSRA